MNEEDERTFEAIQSGRAVAISPTALAILRKDAARYRYLRRSHERAPDEMSTRIWLGADELDRTIDEAISAEKKDMNRTKHRFTVTVTLKAPLPRAVVAEYIDDAIGSWCGQYLDRNTLHEEIEEAKQRAVNLKPKYLPDAQAEIEMYERQLNLVLLHDITNVEVKP